MTLLITGGAGFIGSAIVRRLVLDEGVSVVNVDKLTYAGNVESLGDAFGHERHTFAAVDISDAPALRELFQRHQPSAVLHLAAETHVDRSIDAPDAFVMTNVIGTFTLLEEARRYWARLDGPARDTFRFLHVSSDEVFGSLGPEGRFTPDSPYDPTSPYSATKAAADHLVRAWRRTFGLPTIVSISSNNFGPYQFPEKLIPLTILNALECRCLPVYGDGRQVRDWLHVDDHVAALLLILERGRPGDTFLAGGFGERRNIDVVRAICRLVDELAPDKCQGPREELIELVTDRPAHDLRYAIDPSRLVSTLGWKPLRSFEENLRATVSWYLSHRDWCERVQSGTYRRDRLGLGGTR